MQAHRRRGIFKSSGIRQSSTVKEHPRIDLSEKIMSRSKRAVIVELV